jgi:hypothetical protein
VNWAASSVLGTATYRINSKAATRYLAQSTTASTNSEDIYNDHFAYQGPEVGMQFTQKLPWDVRAVVAAAYQSKKFGAPAYDISGNIVADRRRDRHTIVEFTVTKPFDIGGGLQVELMLECGALRNQSNDNYSDYSTRSIAVALGMGF